MKLTTFTDYSLRVLIYLAAEPARRATIAEIAQVFDVSEHHLTKVVHLLGKQGWIDTVRGNGGGMQLARKPEDICIGKVVRDTEGLDVLAECFAPNGGQCLISRSCGLKRILAEATRSFYSSLDAYTLADITRNRSALAKTLMIRAA